MKNILLFSIIFFTMEISYAGVLSSIVDTGNTALRFISKAGKFVLKSVSNVGLEVVNTISDFFMISNFTFSSEVRGDVRSIDHVSGIPPTINKFAGVDTVAYEYSTTITANPSPKLSISFTPIHRPLHATRIEAASQGYQTFDFGVTYRPSGDLRIGILASRSTNRTAPGNPDLRLYGRGAVGLSIDFETVTDRIMFNIGYQKRELIEISTNIGISQLSQTNFATGFEQREGYIMTNSVGQPSLTGNFSVRFIGSPKYRINFSASFQPDRLIAYYTPDGIRGFFTSSQELKFDSSYIIRPGVELSFGLGRTWERESTRSEYYGISFPGRMFDKRVDRDEFWVRLDFRP